MDVLSPPSWIVVSLALMIVTHVLGIWWSRRYPCATGYYIRAAAAVILQGTWVWLFVRGLALVLQTC